MTKVLMTEPELMIVFSSIINNESVYPGEKMNLIIKLLKITNWLELRA